MKSAPVGLLIGFIVTCGASAQVVVPASPKKFVTRPIEGGGGASIGGVEVLPKDGAKDQNVRVVTHIVLSTSRLWTSTEGKLLEQGRAAQRDLFVSGKYVALRGEQLQQRMPNHLAAGKAGRLACLPVRIGEAEIDNLARLVSHAFIDHEAVRTALYRCIKARPRGALGGMGARHVFNQRLHT